MHKVWAWIECAVIVLVIIFTLLTRKKVLEGEDNRNGKIFLGLITVFIIWRIIFNILTIFKGYCDCDCESKE